MDNQQRSYTKCPTAARADVAAGPRPHRLARNEGGVVAGLLIVILLLVNGLMLAGLFLPEPPPATTRRGIDSPGEVVARDASPAKAAVKPAEKPATEAAKPAEETKAAEAKPAAKPKPAPAPAAKPAPTSAPTTTGTHVVVAGIFRSQKYLVPLEKKLAKMGLPSYRTEEWKKGEAFRVIVADTDGARGKLEGDGYIYSVDGGKLYVYFLFEDQAQVVANGLKAAGAKSGVKPYKGKTPHWNLYVGPMDRASAKEAQKKMEAKRIEGFVTPRPE